MHTLSQYFDDLLKNIRPPEKRRQAAQDIPEDVRRFLRESEDFPTSPPHSHLVGSYARHTTVGDIKDVDFIVHYTGSVKEDPKKVIRSLRKALAEFPSFLNGHGNAEVSESRRSVHVYFEDRDFHLDVVPTLAADGLDSAVYVPDKELRLWIKSDPYGYVQYFTDFNENRNGKVRPLVRILKHWRDIHMEKRRPKSYWLEAIVVHLIDVGKVDTKQPIAVVFHSLLETIHAEYDAILEQEGATPQISDPMLGNNISAHWERTHFETFMRRVQESCILIADVTDRQSLGQC